MQVESLILQAYLKDTGMSGDEFLCRAIQAFIVFQGRTQKKIAEEHRVHEVAFSEMLRRKRKWRKGLLPSILHDLNCYEFFKEAGLI